MTPTVSVPPGTLLPPAHTTLWLRVSHQGQTHRLGPIQCARSFSCNDLKWRLTTRFGLQKERFDIIWLDDDNHQSDITDDVSFFDALEYFTPAAISSTWTPAGDQSASPAASPSSDGSSGSASSDGNGTAVPAPHTPRATIEMHIQVKIFSRITLSDFAPSSAGSVSAGGNNRAWDSESGSEGGESGVDYYEYDEGEGWTDVSGSQSNGKYQQYQQSSGSSSTSSQYRPPLNGKQRLASLHSYTDEQEEDDDDQGTEYAFSGASVNNNQQMFHGHAVPFSVTPPATVHLGAACIVCGSSPIRGVRYICVMCHGVPSFCGSCEDAGRSIQHAPHLATHALLKLVEPILFSSNTNTPTNASFDGSESSIASTLIRAAQALSVNCEQEQQQQLYQRRLSPPGGTVTYGHDVLCSFCSERIVDGPRYLCANCPLDLPTPPIHNAGSAMQDTEEDEGSGSSSSSSTASPSPMILTPHEGYNLCSACEEHSLSIHDADHFFLKIPGSASIARSSASSDKGITPLRLNPYLTIEHRTQGLLPSLYQDGEEDTAWADTQRRVEQEVQGEQSSEADTSSGSSRTVAATLPQRPRTIYEEMQLERRRLEQERRRAVEEVIVARDLDASYPPLPSPSSSQAPPAWAPSAATTTTTPAAAPRDPSPPSRDRPRQHPHLVSYIAALRHPNLVCDLCYEPIHGCWMRCANCKLSFDICSKCEQEALNVHASNHTFAVFKRRVDLDLIKSLVDFVDTAADPMFGPGRAMLPFLLV